MSDQEEEPPAYVDLVTGPTVDIYVGAEKRLFNPHKAILCHASPYFDKCLNGPFREGVEQSITLDDVDVITFGFLLEYLYTSRIPLEVVCKDYDEESYVCTSDSCRLKIAVVLSQLLGFARLTDRLLISANEVIETTLKQLALNIHIGAINDMHLEDIVQLSAHHHVRVTLIRILLIPIVAVQGSGIYCNKLAKFTILGEVVAKFSQELSLELLRLFENENMERNHIRHPITGDMIYTNWCSIELEMHDVHGKR